MPPSSAMPWNSGCSDSCHRPDMYMRTSWSGPASHPSDTTTVRTMKAAASSAMATRRGTSSLRSTDGAPYGLLTLTRAAEDGRAAGDSDGRQRAAAREARLAATAVDEQHLLLAAELTPGVAVRVHRAAPVADRSLERSAQRLVQPRGRLAAHAARDAVGTQAGAVQRLVGVAGADA